MPKYQYRVFIELDQQADAELAATVLRAMFDGQEVFIVPLEDEDEQANQ